MLMVDIAVPRDIEAEVRDLEDVYLYTVDDLQSIIDEGLRSRQEAALQAEEIIDVQVGHFMGWLKSLQSVELIAAIATVPNSSATWPWRPDGAAARSQRA